MDRQQAHERTTFSRELAAHLEMVASLGRVFVESLEIEKTLRQAVERIVSHLQAEAGSLFLLDESGSTLVCCASVGPVDITGMTLPKDQGIVGQSVVENCGFIIRDARRDPNFSWSVDAHTGFVTRSVLCAPMSVKESRVGAIQILNRKGADALFNEEDLYLLEALASVAALAVINARMTKSLVERDRIRREVELAASIQRGLLPDPIEEGAFVHGINLPARHVSGDFFDYFYLPGGRLLFCLADVSGKGVNAAMLMAKVSSLFRCLSKRVHQPGWLLSALNDEIMERVSRGMFITMAAGTLDVASGQVILANAGHEPPLLHRENGHFIAFPADDPPLGILRRDGCPFPEHQLLLGGGTLYLFSDGVTEGYMPDGQFLGENRLRERILELRELPLRERVEAIIKPLQGRVLHDDITLLAVCR